MMPLRNIPVFVVAAILIIARQAPADETIRIGWIGPLTGTAAALGVDSVPAIQLVFDDVNLRGGIHGKKLELVIEDDQYQAQKTVTAYERLAKQKQIKALFIITYGGLFAVSQHAERDGVLLVDPLDCDDNIAALPSNTICVAKKTEDLGHINADHAIRHGYLPASFIYFEGDPFMGTAATSSMNRIRESRGIVAYAEGYALGSTDFKSQLLRIRESGAQSIFFYGYDEMGIAMAQARSLGLKQQFFSMNTLTSPGFRDAAGAAAEGSFVGNWFAPRSAAHSEFLSRFEKRVGRKPYLEISTIPSFDIATIFVQALQDTSSDAPIAQTLKSALYATKNYHGLSGNISVDADGIVRSLKNEMFVFRHGTLEELPRD